MKTIYDIAKKVGVSSTTVSRALNDHNDVKYETKKRILEAAKELDYLPNSQARSLSMKKSWNIGILLSDDGNSGLKHNLFAGIIDSINKTVGYRGYDVTLISGNLGPSKLNYLEHSKYRMFDGVIIATVDMEEESVKDLIKGSEFVAFIDQEIEDAICVNSMNSLGVTKLVNHLFEKGYDEILYIHGQSNNYVTKERIKSFKEQTKSLGIYDNCSLIEGRYTSPEIAYEITSNLIASNKLPKAIMYSDDYSASGGLKCLIEKGISIPNDVAIVGYDGHKLATLLTPSLTTIKQDVDMIGRMIANKLIDSIEKESLQSEIIELPVSLMIGNTT